MREAQCEPVHERLLGGGGGGVCHRGQGDPDPSPRQSKVSAFAPISIHLAMMESIQRQEEEDEEDLDHYKIELAKSGRAKCKRCEIKIDIGTPKILKDRLWLAGKHKVRMFYANE